jgi:hypothetical protein
VGRNALGPLPDKEEALRLLAGWLSPGGRLSLAETVVRRAQRLYGLVDLSSLGDDLRERVAGAEEQIYGEAHDPLINWDVADLDEVLERAGYHEVTVQEEVQEAEMLITPATVERWFAMAPDQDRPSYAQHLLCRITADELVEVAALFQRQLGGQAVVWQTCIAFVSGQI